MGTTNEPVAWMLLRDEVCSELTEWFGDMRGWEEFLGDNEKIVELYTHPVKDKPHPKCDEACMYLCQMRELTDEEIEELIWNTTDMKDFARAILRKAQEK